MALAAPMSAANGRNHNRPGGHNDKPRCEKFEKRDKRDRGHRPAPPRACNHRPERGSVVMHRPPRGKYVMYAGRPHWLADNVIYQIVKRGGLSVYMVVSYL